MKWKNSSLYSLSMLLGALCILPGCGLNRGLFLRHDTVSEQVATVPASTNRVPVVTAPGVTNIVEVIRPASAVTNLITNTVFEPNPAVLSTIRTVQEVNSTVNPLPFSGAITGGLGLLAAALGYIARVKSTKASLVPALIQGVELANNPEVKESIRKVASSLGVQKELHAEVQAQT